jgi:hypothetical protein
MLQETGLNPDLDMNGRTAFRVEGTGQTYKDYQEAQIRQVADAS